jgi:hypothetical protein
MALIDVKRVCERLATKGWAELLRRHGLDITKPALGPELQRELPIDRSLRGFEDFCLAGVRGIEPGSPAASLLYHALASPDIHPTPDGEPSLDTSRYPTLAELDAVENFIYGLTPFDPTKLARTVVAVFAYQYRPAASTAHGYHADLVFSRVGVARVGTAPASWDGARRGFRSDPPGAGGIAVSPARYAAFLAEARRPVAADAIMGRRDQDDRRRAFLFPLQKLFPGVDCVGGTTVTLDFKEYHRNDKLRRLHTAGRLKVARGFDVDTFPFVRDSRAGDLVELRREGASVLVAPRHHPTLVRTVEQKNARSGRREVVRFVVPAAREANRFSTSLQIPSDGDVRHAPEYANIRHRVVKSADGRLQVEDMRSLPDPEFTRTLKAGQYEAAHYTDDTCDGALVAVVGGVASGGNVAAYSLVAAPDFFPLADQIEVTSWVRRNFQNLQEHFRQGAPWPLCEGRRAANLELPRPDAPRRKAFDRMDETMPAVVGVQPLSRQRHALDRKKRFASFLPDSASNFYEPGWDVALAGNDDGEYFATYGLGSPFPEDSKLCAALNSFWPAVAPDASRTFRVDWSPTAIPMMDGELGYHRDHPSVRANRVPSRRGWDGEYGPFFESVAGVEHVNYASLDRSDYVSNALRGDVDVRLTSWIDSQELIRRMDALRRCITALPPANDRVGNTKLWLVTAETVVAWEQDASRADSALAGSGFVYVFARVGEDGDTPGQDVSRRRVAVQRRFDCQISANALLVRHDGGAWERVRE